MVWDNPELGDLFGFDALDMLGAEFTVHGNTSLSECLPRKLLTRLQSQGFDGPARTTYNMPDSCD